jgi:hypothetical protein
MALIPRFLLQHKALVESYLGESGTGPQYATPVTIRCFVLDKRSVVRGANQDQVISSSQLFCRPTAAPLPPKSRVTINGKAATVITYNNADGGRWPTPDHIQVFLT